MDRAVAVTVLCWKCCWLCRPFNKLGWKVAFALNYFIIVVYAAFTVGGIFFSIQRIVQQVRTSSDIIIVSVYGNFLVVCVHVWYSGIWHPIGVHAGMEHMAITLK